MTDDDFTKKRPSLIRLPAVKIAVNKGKTAIYAAIRAGMFPIPVKLNPTLQNSSRGAVAWKTEEIEKYIECLPRARTLHEVKPKCADEKKPLPSTEPSSSLKKAEPSRPSEIKPSEEKKPEPQ